MTCLISASTGLYQLMKALNWNLRESLDGTIENFFDFVAEFGDRLNQPLPYLRQLL